MRENIVKKPANQAKVNKKLTNDVLTGISRQEMFGTPPVRDKMSHGEKHSHFALLPTSILKNPIAYLKSLTRADLNTLRFSVSHGWKRGVWATQATIAEDANICPTSVGRAHKNLALDGVLHKKYRGVKRTNFVIINPQFKRELVKPWVRRLIGDLIPELAISPGLQLSLLMSISEQNVRQLNINITPLEIDSSYLDFFKKSSTPIAEHSPIAGQEKNMSIPSYIEAIKSLRLAISGQVKLAKYSQTAIEYADSQIQRRSNIRSKFNYFDKLVREQQQIEGEPLNYKLYNDLVAIHGVPIDGKELLEDKIFAWDVAKRSPSNSASVKQGNPERDRDAARYTSGSNAQADWWKETLALRETNHSLYIERIKSYQQSLARKKKDEQTVTRTDLDIAWEHYCQSNQNVIALEETDPVNYAGYGYKMFLDSPWGAAYVAKASPSLRILLSPLLSKVYPAQGTTATDVQPTDPAPQPEATHVSEFRDISVWATHTVQTEIVETPYIDETSPWEEV